MELHTGDILTTTIVNNPFFYHKGIIVMHEGKTLVAHNTPSKRNSSGGNVVLESLDDFLASGRKILKRKTTALNSQHILDAVESVRKKRFDKMKFNCDDFIHFVRTGKHKSSISVFASILTLPRSITAKATIIDGNITKS